jgi:hypothetical protein
MITLTVPFVYEAIIVKPRCRKPSLVTVKDRIDVQIQTATLRDLPVAFKVGERNIRWDGKRLWDVDHESVANRPDRKVDISEVLKNTASNGKTYEFSSAGTAAPFHNFWHDLKWSSCRLGTKYNLNACGFDNWIEDADVVEKSDIAWREWIEDNRGAVIDRLNSIVASIMAVDGTMFCLASEPRYEVNSFGAGHNYSVAMFVSYGYNPNLSNKCYFNALAFKQAQDALLERSPDKNQEAEPNGGFRIDVLIPEAVNCNPARDHVL